MMAKVILPWFGGSPSVWTTSILFFQFFLLFGYLYSHLLCRFLTIKKGIVLHLLFLGFSLLMLPVYPSSTWKLTDKFTPEIKVLLTLFSTISIPYLLLSTSGPLIQFWFSKYFENKSPYYLFSISNFGSLLGLVSYPFFFEPFFGLKLQTHIWSITNILYILMCSIIGIFVFKGNFANNEISKKSVGHRYSFSRKASWIFLAFLGVVIMLGATNEMTQDLPPIPFLWVLSLGIFLISFIIPFAKERREGPNIWKKTFNISLLLLILLKVTGHGMPIVFQVITYAFILYSACMVCHIELAATKPKEEYLTEFYLYISLGGGLGSLFVTFLGPVLFNQYFEMYLALLSIYGFIGIQKYELFSKTSKAFEKGMKVNFILWLSSGLICFSLLYFKDNMMIKNLILKDRNFYGVLKILDTKFQGDEIKRALFDGKTIHGLQFLNSKNTLSPSLYYTEESGVGLAFNTLKNKSNSKVGIIGLGAGTLASYAKENDIFDFYEINPQVIDIANNQFTYLKNSKAKIKTYLGDARITLEEIYRNKGTKSYDLIVLDAFSSDAIPTHLLTREAFLLYTQHLSEEGTLAIHISNRHIDLFPVVASLAKEKGYLSVEFNDHTTDEKKVYSIWALVSKNKEFISSIKSGPFKEKTKRENVTEVIWTDDYTNLLRLFKFL